MSLLYRYGPIAALVFVYVLIALTQLPIIQNTWHYSFDDGTYSHAFLIPFISIYLYGVLHKSAELRFNQKVNIASLAIMMFCAYLLWVSSNAQFPTAYRLSFIFLIASSTAVIFKPSIRLIFPAVFLVFLMPVWGVLTNPLQTISTLAVTNIMAMTNIPIYVEGNTIAIPSGVFEIAGGCSGLRYLIVSLAISSLFNFLYIRKRNDAIKFLCIAIIGALLTNWIRITALIIIGHYSEMQSGLMEDHNNFGWYLYIPFMMWLLHYGNKFAEDQNQPTGKKNPSNMRLNSLILPSVILLLISNPLRSIVNLPAEHFENCADIATTHPQPSFYRLPKKCRLTTFQLESFEIEYIADKAHIEGALDHYANRYIPDGFIVEKEITGTKRNTFVVSREGEHFLIAYQFLVNGQRVKEMMKLKRYKIFNSLLGKPDIRLHWQSIKCKHLCQTENQESNDS